MSVDFAAIQTTLDTNKDQYLDLTHQLNNYNEIYNVNFYLKNLNTLEYDRLDRANQNIKSKIMKMKQEYMLLDYGVHENKMRSKIMVTTLVLLSIIFVLLALFYQNRMSLNMAVMITVALSMVYFGVVIFILISNSKRRRYAWEQYYWNDMKKKS